LWEIVQGLSAGENEEREGKAVVWVGGSRTGDALKRLTVETSAVKRRESGGGKRGRGGVRDTPCSDGQCWGSERQCDFRTVSSENGFRGEKNKEMAGSLA